MLHTTLRRIAIHLPDCRIISLNIFQYDPNDILNPDGSLNPTADYAYDSDMILVPITVSTTTSSYATDTNIIPYLVD